MRSEVFRYICKGDEIRRRKGKQPLKREKTELRRREVFRFICKGD